MKQYRTLLTIIFSLTLSGFVCQVIAAERTIKLQPVSETPGKLEITKSKPKSISTRPTDKLRPVTKTPDQRRPVTKSPAKVTAVGFCCKDGKYSSSTKTDCQRLRGAYFTTEREAILKCTGYCCADFAVSQVTEKKCKSARGKYFGNKQKADRFCDSQKGFCCIGGKTRQLTKRECTAKRGEFFTSKKIAAKECRQEAGYCNLKGKTQRLTEAQCIKKKGSYFATPVLAKKNLVKLRQQKLAEKQAGKKRSATKGKVAAGLKLKKDLGAASTLALQKNPGKLTLSRPDLVPTRVWVNPVTCRLWAEWENRGTAAPDKTFTERFLLNGSFRHGSTPMTGYSFDSRNGYPIPANYKVNHQVTDLYEIVILGQTHVTYTIDGTGVHAETNENNNTIEADLTCTSTAVSTTEQVKTRALQTDLKLSPQNLGVAKNLTLQKKQVNLSIAKPDLIVQSFTITPDTVQNGMPVAATLVVKNIGGPSPESKMSVVFDANTPQNAFLVPNVDVPGSGESITITKDLYAWWDRCAELAYTVTIDSKHQVDESNEDNNTKSYSVVVEDRPVIGFCKKNSKCDDYYINSGAGEPVYIGIDVFNYGCAPSPAGLMSISFPGGWPNPIPIPPLEPGKMFPYVTYMTWDTPGVYEGEIVLKYDQPLYVKIYQQRIKYKVNIVE